MNYEKHFVKSSNVDRKLFLFAKKNSFVYWKDIGEEKFAIRKKKEFGKKISFMKNGNECWQNEDFIRLEHKENFTLIMSEISEGKEMRWEKTSIIRRTTNSTI